MGVFVDDGKSWGYIWVGKLCNFDYFLIFEC